MTSFLDPVLKQLLHHLRFEMAPSYTHAIPSIMGCFHALAGVGMYAAVLGWRQEQCVNTGVWGDENMMRPAFAALNVMWCHLMLCHTMSCDILSYHVASH